MGKKLKPLAAIGFEEDGSQLKSATPIQPINDTGGAIGFDTTLEGTPSPVEGPTKSKQYTEGYIIDSSLQDRLAENQDGWDQFANFLGQTGVSAVAGTIEAGSYLFDFQQHFEKLKGDEQEYSNWLADAMKQAKEATNQDILPVYLSEQNEGFQPGSAEWWAHHGGEGLGSTLSLLIPGLAVAKIGKAAGLGKIGQAVSATGASRYAESTMEANQVFQESYNKLLAEGKSEDEAKARAGEAASAAWNTNWLFAIQDLAQFSAITKGFGSLAKGKKGLGFSQLLKEMASEGAEEAGQYIVSEEAKRLAMDTNTDYFGEGFSKRLSDYIQDDEFATSTLLGAVGGGVFHVAGKIGDTVGDVAQGDYITKAKDKIYNLVKRGIQKERANYVDDTATSQKVTDLDFTEQLIDKFNKGKLSDYKNELEELKRQPDLSTESRQNIDNYIQDVDFVTTEEARLKSSNVPEGLHKPIILTKLEQKQLSRTREKLSTDINNIEQELITSKELSPELQAIKKTLTTLEAYKRLAVKQPKFNEKVAQLEKAYQEQRIPAQLGFPELDKALSTSRDEELYSKAFQLISTEEKQYDLKGDLQKLNTPEGISEYLAKQEAKVQLEKAKALVSSQEVSKEQVTQLLKSTTNPEAQVLLSDKLKDIISQNQQSNSEGTKEIIEASLPEDTIFTPDMEANLFGPDLVSTMPPEIDPNMEVDPEAFDVDMIDPEPEIDFAGGITAEQAQKWGGLSKEQVEDLLERVDSEERTSTQTVSQEQADKDTAAVTQTKERLSVPAWLKEYDEDGSKTEYTNNITQEKSTADQIFAVDSKSGQLLANTPIIKVGDVVTLRVENDFPWTLTPGFKPDKPENYIINVYVNGVQKPIKQLPSADNKTSKSPALTQLRDRVIRAGGVLTTTVTGKNVGSIRKSSMLNSLDILQSDFVEQNGEWNMQMLTHNPILGFVDFNGNPLAPNVGAMTGVSDETANKVRETLLVQRSNDLSKLKGKVVTFRTAPDGSMRIVGLIPRMLNEAEVGWVNNNLASIISSKNYAELANVVHIPQHSVGVYSTKGNTKKPDLLKLDRNRIHIVNTTTKTADVVFPVLGKDGKPVWIIIDSTQLNEFISDKPIAFKLVNSNGAKSTTITNYPKQHELLEAFNKLLERQFKNINKDHINSEIRFTDPVSKEHYDSYYDYLNATNSIQTDLPGSKTIGYGEDSSYSFNQVALYLDPNPSEIKFEDSEEIIITTGVATPQPPTETIKVNPEVNPLDVFFGPDAKLKPATTPSGYTFKLLTEKELQWFKDSIGEEFLVVAKGVDSFVAANGVQAFGQYYNSLVTVAQFAPSGTAYHEAGHFLFDPKNGLITKQEKERILDEASKIFNIKRSYDEANKPKLKAVDYKLRALEILQSPKADEVFRKGDKNNWPVDKILTELQVPKEQKELLLSLNTRNREQLIQELAQQYSYVVEVNTAKEIKNRGDYYTGQVVDTAISDEEYELAIKKYSKKVETDPETGYQYFELDKPVIDNPSFEEGDKVLYYKEEYGPYMRIIAGKKQTENPTQIYSSLTVPGGTNYTENEIKTPNITPSIKGHAEFATDNGIGWFRSDDKGIENINLNKVIDFDDIVEYKGNQYKVLDYAGNDGERLLHLSNNLKVKENEVILIKKYSELEKEPKTRRILEVQSDLFQKGRDSSDLAGGEDTEPGFARVKPLLEDKKGNQFLQLLNKDSNWVSFFLKSIVQDSANKGYEKVLFPTGNTASEIEGHETLEEFKAQREDRLSKLKQTAAQYREAAESYVFSGRLPKMPETAEEWSKAEEIINENVNREIKQVEAELERVEREGFAALSPIYNFYEKVVGNTLNKIYGKDTIKRIKDEYGNEWYELKLKEEHKGTIKLKPVSEVEQTGDYMIEEKIMEEFEKYKLADGKYKPKVAEAKNFFSKLLKLIKNLIGFRSPVEKLFEKIDNTVLSEAQREFIRNKAKTQVDQDPKLKKLPGFRWLAQQQQAIQTFSSEIMRLAAELSRERDVNLAELLTDKGTLEKFINDVKGGFYIDLVRINSIPVSNRTQVDQARYYSYLAMGINEGSNKEQLIPVPESDTSYVGTFEDPTNEVGIPIDGFRTKVLKDLGRYGFQIRLLDNTTYINSDEENSQSADNLELKEEDEAERLYDIDSTLVNPSASMSQRVKLFLATIPEPVIGDNGLPTGEVKKTIFGTTKYMDASKVDGNLALKLRDSINPFTRLEELSKNDPIIKVVYEALVNEKNKNNTQLFHEFLAKYNRDGYYKKTILYGTKVVDLKPNEIDPVNPHIKKRVEFYAKTIDADRASSDRTLLNRWREESVRKKVIDTDGTVNQGKADYLFRQFSTFKEKVDNAKKQKQHIPYNELKVKFNEILKEFGVVLPSQLWQEIDSILNPGLKYKKLENMFFGLRGRTLEQLILNLKEGKDPYEGSSVFTNLSKASSIYLEDSRGGAFRNEAGNQEYPINFPSALTELFNRINQTPKDVYDFFTQDEFYKSNEFLKVVKNNPEKIELNFTSASRRNEDDAKEFAQRTEVDSLIMRFTSFFNNGGNEGWFFTGTASDKTKQAIVSLPKYKANSAKDFLFTVLKGTMKSEVARIQRLKAVYNPINKQTAFPLDIKNYAHATKFLYIPGLNNVANLTELVSSGDISSGQYVEAVKQANVEIDAFIESEYNAFLSYLSENDIIKITKDANNNDVVTSDRIPDGILGGREINTFLQEFFYNDLAWRLEMSKVLMGDIALYSSTDDYFKRAYQLVTPGVKGYSETPKSLTRVVYPKQMKLNSEQDLTDLAALIGDSDIVTKYREINKTDAQSLITISGYRELALSFGQWTKDQELIYNLAWSSNLPANKVINTLVQEEKITEEEGKRLKRIAYEILIQTLKPFQFNDVEVRLPDNKVMIIKEQFKDSITPITPELASVHKGYANLLDYMRLNKVDIMSAEDTVKVGAYGVVQDFIQPVQDWQKRKVKLSNFRFPQLMPDKKKEEITGTQFHKLILGNVNNSSTYKVGNKTLAGKELKELYNVLWEQKIKASSDKLRKKLSGFKISEDPVKRKEQLFKIKTLFDQELLSRDVNENYQDMLELVRTHENVVDFTLPISFPAFGQKFQSILSNVFKKNIIKQKSAGYAAINLADFGVGYSDELKFIRNQEGEIIEAEIGLPIDFFKTIGLERGKHILPNGSIVWDNLNNEQRKALQLILYRIPTSNKSSMTPVRVVKITPPQLNNIVIIPGELTVQQGLDFDVDKSQLLRRELSKEGKIDAESIDTQLFDIYWAILTSKEHIKEVVTPLDTPTLRSKFNEYVAKGLIDLGVSSSVASTHSDVKAEIRNKDGKAEIGIASRFNTGHAVFQTILDYLGVSTTINISTNSDYKFDKLGRREDSTGKLISENHAESQQAALDAAKSPLLAYLGVVTGTMAAFHTMIDFGVPLSVITDFFMQPVIREWTKFYKQEDQRETKATERLLNSYPDLAAAYEELELQESLPKKQRTKRTIISSQELAANVDKLLQQDTEHDARVLKEFLKINAIAKQLGKINNVLSIDTFQDATSIEALESFVQQVKDVTDTDASIYVDPRVFDLEQAPIEARRLAAFYKYGIQDAISFTSQFFPLASQSYSVVRDYVAKNLGIKRMTNKDLIKSINQFIDYYNLQGDSVLFKVLNDSHPLKDKSDYRYRWSFFDSSKSIAKYVDSVVEKFPNLKNNALIRNLETQRVIGDKVQSIGIRNTTSNLNNSEITAGWYELLQHPELEVRGLAHDLVRFAVQSSGFMYNSKSMTDLIPIQFWVETGISELWRDVALNAGFSNIDQEGVALNFIRHNFKTIPNFPELYGRFTKEGFKSDSISAVKTEKGTTHITEFVLNSWYSSDAVPRFFRLNDNVLGDYRLYESNPENPLQYKEVQPLGEKNSYYEISSDGRNTSVHPINKATKAAANPWEKINPVTAKSYPLFGKLSSTDNSYISKYLPTQRNSAETVIKTLLEFETNTSTKELLQKMLSNVNKISNVSIEVVEMPSRSTEDTVLGMLDVAITSTSITSTIKINQNGAISSDAEMRYILAHELVHAYSVGVIQNPQGEQQINFVRNINRIRKEYITTSNAYGLTNDYEFIAELASNSSFRKDLQKKGFWSRIIRLIRKMLGFTDQFDKILNEFYTIIDKAENLQGTTPNEFLLIKKSEKEQQEERKGTKRIDILQQMLSSLSAREDRLRSKGKKDEAGALRAEISTLEELSKTKRNEAVVRYLINTENEMNSLKEAYNLMSKDPSKLNPDVLYSMREQLVSYKLLDSFSDQIRLNPDNFVPKGGNSEQLLKSLDNLRAEVHQLSNDTRRLAIRRFASVIKDTLNNPNLTVESIVDQLEVADRDITWLERWTGTAMETNDVAVQTAIKLLTENNAAAYRAIQDALYDTAAKKQTAKIAIKKQNANGKGYHWAVEEVNFTSVGMYKALDEFEQWLKKKGKNVGSLIDKFGPILEQESFSENSDGVHLISPFSVEGKQILSIKEGSPDYPLRQFYETFALGYLKSQENIPSYSLRPGLRVPSIQRSLLESVITEKGTNKLSAIKEAAIDAVRKRYDETDFKAVDENGNPQSYLPVRFIAKQDGQEGRLSTREVSLDLATTLPLFIHEMYSRKGLESLQADLELGKMVLAEREVMKTKRIKGPGLVPILTREREGVVLESGKFETIKGEQSQSYAAFDTLLRRFLYGEYKKSEGDFEVKGKKFSVSKIVDSLLSFTGFKIMIGNIAIPLTNAIVGEVTMMKEVIGGNIINKNDYAAGKKLFTSSAMSAVADLGRREKKTKWGRVFTYFNPLDSQRPVSDLGVDTNYMRTIFDKITKSGASTVDYYLGSTAIGAVMNRFKATNSKGEEVSLYDAIEITKDGKVQLNPGYTYKGRKEITSGDINEVRNYTLRLFQLMNGVYNRMDKPAMTEYAAGRLLAFMRNWLKSGMDTRWKTKFYDERLGQDNEGHYVSALVAFNNVFSKNGFIKGTVDSLRILTWFGATDPELLLLPNELGLSEDEKEQIINLRKANIRKTLFELYVIGALGLIMALGWDDDNDDSYVLYMLARVRRELTTFYSPSTAWDVLRSPTVALNTIEGFAKINYDLVNSAGAFIAGEDQPIYERGPSKGENKLVADIKKQFGLGWTNQFEGLDQKTRLIVRGMR